MRGDRRRPSGRARAWARSMRSAPRPRRTCRQRPAVALSLAAKAAGGKSLLWARQSAAGYENGRPYPPGLGEIGVDPGRMVFVSAGDATAVLKAGVEAARCAALGAVVIGAAWAAPGARPDGQPAAAARRRKRRRLHPDSDPRRARRQRRFDALARLARPVASAAGGGAGFSKFHPAAAAPARRGRSMRMVVWSGTVTEPVSNCEPSLPYGASPSARRYLALWLCLSWRQTGYGAGARGRSGHPTTPRRLSRRWSSSRARRGPSNWPNATAVPSLWA